MFGRAAARECLGGGLPHSRDPRLSSGAELGRLNEDGFYRGLSDLASSSGRSRFAKAPGLNPGGGEVVVKIGPADSDAGTDPIRRELPPVNEPVKGAVGNAKPAADLRSRDEVRPFRLPSHDRMLGPAASSAPRLGVYGQPDTSQLPPELRNGPDAGYPIRAAAAQDGLADQLLGPGLAVHHVDDDLWFLVGHAAQSIEHLFV